MVITHTRGPWRESWIRPDAEQGHTFAPSCAIVADDPFFGTIRIADIADPETGEEEANARLFAAAPDLLDLVRRFVPVEEARAVLARIEGAQ